MLLRRHYIASFLYTLYTVLVLFTFTSCASDRFDEPTLGTGYSPNPGKVCYLSLRIESVDNWSQTRAGYYYKEGDEDDPQAGEFVQGSENEHAIGDEGNFVIFFDDQGTFCSLEKLELDLGHDDNPKHDPSIGGSTFPINPGNNYIEALYTTKFYPRKDADGKYLKNENEEYIWPKYCLVVLNGENVKDELQKLNDEKTIDDVLGIVWGDDNPSMIGRYSGDDGKNYFTMTNSAYVGRDQNNVDKLQTTVEIGPEHYSEDEEERVDLHIHVERMLAKYTFQPADNAESFPYFYPSTDADILMFNGFDDNGAPKYDAKKWRVKVTGWGINALETKSHIFKNIKPDADYFTGWNDAYHLRSYWSEDPDYSEYNYPWQYRKSIDENIKYYDKDDDGTGSILRNYSFQALNLGNADWDQPIYTPEHTYNANAADINGKLDDREELLAGTHLLVGAELQIQKDDKTDEYETLNWHRERNGLYYKSAPACFAALMHAFNQLLNSQEAMEFTYYEWDKYAPGKDPLVANTAGGCYLSYNGRKVDNDYIQEIANMKDENFEATFGSMAPATLRRGDGKCLPWIDGSIDDGVLKILDADGNEIKIYEKDTDVLGAVICGEEIGIATANDIKSLLYEWLGAVDHFNQGKMYYAHGIDNPLSATDNTAKWGVVRNNWYRFNLEDITSMGIPVDDPDQPIVPDRVGNEDKINVSVYLLDWHDVETTIDELP